MASRTFFAAVVLVTLAGCGGSGSSLPSPFAGHWIGTFTTDNATNGTADITVATNGHVAGTGQNITQGANFTVVGNIKDSGQLTGKVSGDITGDLDGTLAIAGNGHLKGTVIQTIPGSGTVGVTFDLTKN